MRFKCFPILPLVYNDALSYYEAICKLVEKINELIKKVNELEEKLNNM